MNKPDIRFNGFEKEWEEKNYKEVFDTSVSNNTFSRAELTSEKTSTKNVHYGDILIKYNSILSVKKDDFPFIPDNVKCIGYSAFQECKSLSSITIPDSVTSISGYSFAYCKSLESITIPDSVKSIGNGAFYSCKSLKEIIIPNSVESIGRDAFSFCDSLKEVNFKGKTSEEVKQMRNYPFGIKFI